MLPEAPVERTSPLPPSEVEREGRQPLEPPAPQLPQQPQSLPMETTDLERDRAGKRGRDPEQEAELEMEAALEQANQEVED